MKLLPARARRASPSPRRARVLGSVVGGSIVAGSIVAFVPAIASAALSVEVVDQSSAVLVDAVVYVVPASGKVPSHGPLTAVISQVDQAFSPRVSVVQTNTTVTFPNRDTVRHQVYSFSPAKIFELKLYSGTDAQPVVFDKPGLVVMGCSIHDEMVGFVQVVDTPWYAKTGTDGIARIDGVPNEDVIVHVWHWKGGEKKEVVKPIKAAPDAKLRVTYDLKT